MMSKMKGKRKVKERQLAVSSEDSHYSKPRMATMGEWADVAEKAPDDLARIDAAFTSKRLFAHMDMEQRRLMYRCMALVDFKEGADIMTQGRDGDSFYVVNSGAVDVYQTEKGGSFPGALVASRVPGESFGELALMYGTPRSATCRAKTASSLWVLSRDAFRCVIVSSTQEKKKRIEAFLSKVELLADMNHRDRSRIADALKLITYKEGDAIVTEGDAKADFFYIIEQGAVSVTAKGEEVAKRTVGDYFGELALLKDAPRIATVTAVGGPVTCLSLSRNRFQRLFGTEESMNWGARYAKEVEEVEKIAHEGAADGAWSGELGSAVALDQFTIKQTLGFGGYGRVQLVQHKANEKVYAMKIMSKRDILKKGQVQHVKDEKNILAAISRRAPFVVQLAACFQDEYNLFLVLDFVNGGELYSLLQNRGKLGQPWAKLFTAEITLAFQYFSTLGIAYRDLKPENLLIDETGHMKITDFGLAKEVEDRTYTMCGTPDYLAPEIILNKGHHAGADYWALGTVCYEMLTGLPPFYQADAPQNTLERILKNEPRFDEAFWDDDEGATAKAFVRSLLESDLTKRLGCLKGGVQDIMAHAYFKDVDFAAVLEGKVPAPWVPPSSGHGDTQNFDDYEAYSEMKTPISDADQDHFKDFC